MAKALERQHDELIMQMEEIRELRNKRKMQKTPPTPPRLSTPPPKIALMTEARLGLAKFDAIEEVKKILWNYLGTDNHDLTNQVVLIMRDNEPNDWIAIEELINLINVPFTNKDMIQMLCEDLKCIWEKVRNQTMAKEPQIEFEPEDVIEPEKPVMLAFMSGMRLGVTVRLATMTKHKLAKTQLKEVCSYCEKPDYCMYECLDWLKNLDLGLDKPKKHLPTMIKVAAEPSDKPKEHLPTTTKAVTEPCEVCDDKDHTEAKCRAMGYSLDSELDKEELLKTNTIIRAMRIGKEIVDTEVCSFCEKSGHGMDTCRDRILN
ncbi:hypothetical protein RUND412_011070 [Rhizina undulata]